ncbi:MAG: Crp/Fnr family transcriptional regulator [Candidatus Eremiobacteraeota bacterium]|nr:Crp/Fnr family transcriptional regulator [Candidatus Eremiobacteraeota bacterium]
MNAETLLFARRNRLLDELGDDALARLLEGHSRVTLRLKAVLHEPGLVVECAYFPVTAVISWLSEMRSGKRSEVMTFGYEGMAGVAAAFDANQGAISAIVQSEGEAIAVPADHFKDVLAADRNTAMVFYRYASSLMNIIAQNSACNRLHELSERCAKWLLLIHDRIRNDVLPIDQQLLADMLGARRQSISVTTSMLQEAGLIERSRSRIRITDRAGLEKAACECYPIVASESVPEGAVGADQHAVRSDATAWFRARRKLEAAKD